MSETTQLLKQAGEKLGKVLEAQKASQPPAQEAPAAEVKVETPPANIVPTIQAPTPTAAPKVEQPTAQAPETPQAAPTINWDEMPDDVLEKLLEKKGLKATPTTTETDAQRLAREKREADNLIAFGITQLGLTPETFTKPNQIKDMANEDVVYDDFKAKELAANKSIKEETIRKRFEKMYELKPISADDLEFMNDEEQAEYHTNRKWGQDLIDAKANKIREKLNQPLEFVKKEFENRNNFDKLINNANKEVDIFAKDFGSNFILNTDEGDIPIDFPSPKYKEELINKVREEVIALRMYNPNGSLDVSKIAQRYLLSDLQPQIIGVLKSNAIAKGEAKGLEPFKNPITTPNAQKPAMDDKKVEEKQTLDGFKKARGAAY